MADYVLAEDEYVVLRELRVKVDTGKKFSMPHESDLMLTNRNIVLFVKGMLGKVKRCEVYPLDQIRVLDGRPQCRLDTSEFMVDKLEISFRDKVVLFAFDDLDAKQHIRMWVNEIYKLLTGSDAPREVLSSTGLAGSIEGITSSIDLEGVAEAMGKVYGSFHNAVDAKAAQAAPLVACRCPSCNASIKGRRGETIQCPFCDTNITVS